MTFSGIRTVPSTTHIPNQACSQPKVITIHRHALLLTCWTKRPIGQAYCNEADNERSGLHRSVFYVSTTLRLIFPTKLKWQDTGLHGCSAHHLTKNQILVQYQVTCEWLNRAELWIKTWHFISTHKINDSSHNDHKTQTYTFKPFEARDIYLAQRDTQPLFPSAVRGSQTVHIKNNEIQE